MYESLTANGLLKCSFKRYAVRTECKLFTRGNLKQNKEGLRIDRKRYKKGNVLN